MKAKRDREDPCCICSHYHDYENGEPCTVCGHVMTTTERRQQESVLPTAIIPGSLYLGSYDTASRSEILKAMGITHILNTVANNQALFRNTFTYHTLSSNPPDFNECFTFIEKSIKEGHKVLVYCMTGVSRSPAVIVAYLMHARKWRLAECYKWVKERRMSTIIKQDEAERLIALETQLFGGCSVPLGLQSLDAAMGPGGNSIPSFAAQPAAQQPQPQPHAGSTAQQGATAPMFGTDAQGVGAAQWRLGQDPGQAFQFGGGCQAPTFGGDGAAGTDPGPAFVFGGGSGNKGADMEM